ncbi:transposase [bacterium]|nr:transposase [bacterium]
MKEGMVVRFTEAFKVHVVREVETGRISQSEVSRRYGILGHSTILKWIRKYGKLPTHGSKRKGSMRMEEKEIELLRLENEIKELKQELENARFKNVVLETLVDVAERELGIPIRKKYGAKRSVK